MYCYYSACRRRGGVLKYPLFCFFLLFFFGVESWAAAHGPYRCAVYPLLSEPMSTRLLKSISSRICRQNTQFNTYTATSKQQEGCTFKDSHPKCFITTNFDKFHREAFARGGERGDVLTACFRDIQSQRSIRMEFVRNYYDFIRREGLSLAIWFDIVESVFGENIHMTVKIFANTHQLMFLVIKLVWIRIEYSLV